MGATVGGLTAAAAAACGLLEGTKVIQGGADAFVGMIGLGVVEPGQLALITGSSHLHLGVAEEEFHAKGIFGTYRNALVESAPFVVEGGQTSTGSVVNWFKNLCGGGDSFYDDMNREASAIPPGCEGVVALDHFQGNRTPHVDALSRGAISGLTLKHSKAHVFRAILEGVCCGTRLIFETMTRAGYEPKEVVIAGGATRSELWLQIHADVTGVPHVVTECSDAPALGCAILAAVGAGLVWKRARSRRGDGSQIARHQSEPGGARSVRRRVRRVSTAVPVTSARRGARAERPRFRRRNAPSFARRCWRPTKAL